MSSSENRQSYNLARVFPEEAEQKAKQTVDVPYPPLQIVNSVTFFSLFSLSLPSLCFHLNPLYSISTIHYFSSDQKIKTSNFITFCFTNGTYFCILFHTMTYFF